MRSRCTFLRKTLPLAMVTVLFGACAARINAEGDAPEGGSGGSSQNTGGTAGTSPCSAGDGTCSDAAEPSVIRRLTRSEYAFTIADLLGTNESVSGSFPAEEVVKGFNNNANALSFPGLLAEQSFTVTAQLAKAAVEKSSRFAACAQGTLDATCARQFIASFGKKAWRRPLSSAEVDKFLSVFTAAETPMLGLELASQSLLISAPFFYRIEQRGQGRTKPTSWEMASRLSYTLWASLPDDELFAAAEADKLRDRDDIVAQANRMMKDAKLVRAYRSYMSQWFDLPRISVAAKDPKVFPTWNTEYPALLRAGAEAFLDHVARQGKISDLFTAPFVFTNDTLAPYYGVAKPGSSAFVKVDLKDKTRASGMLTQGGILAGHAGFSSTSPTFRGKFVREQFLCGTIPKAPPNVNVMIGAADPTQTTREHYSEHIKNPQCVGCHSLMDPIGFAFEEFDAIGNRRTVENGKPIDATGDAVGVDVGKFEGVNQLGERLASSEDATRCLATQWFRFSFGRLESAEDDATLDGLTKVVRDEGTFAALMVATVQSSPFLEL